MPVSGENRQHQGYNYTFDGTQWVRGAPASAPAAVAPGMREAEAQAGIAETQERYEPVVTQSVIDLREAQRERTETQTELDRQKMEQARRQARALADTAKTSAAIVNSVGGQLLTHPGLPAITGTGFDPLSGAFGRQSVETEGAVLERPRVFGGSSAANAFALHEQLQGQAFMQARQMLKGGGAITNFESNRAENAYARLSLSQSTEAYAAALKEFMDAVQEGARKLEAYAAAPEDAQAELQRRQERRGQILSVRPVGGQ